jgi:amidase
MNARAEVLGWLEQSHMGRRGIGASKTPTTHELSESVQGKYHYTIGPYSEPVLEIEPGDRVVVETQDCFEGAIKSETDLPSRLLRMPFLNPQCGPIVVAGAEKGDVAAVYIESMKPRGDNPRGTCCLIREFGGLTGTYYTATLNEPLPEIVKKINLDEKKVYWSDRLTLPYRPHIGTIGLAPEIDSINSLTPDNHGGNMDVPDMGPGSVTYFPVRSKGGRLFLGDAHACQGEGEVCGVAVEHASVTTIKVDLIKHWAIEWPRMEREDYIMTLGSARPLEDATRIAFRELVRWLNEDYGFDLWDAYMTLSVCGRSKLGNFVDPKYTVGAMMPKRYLESSPQD